MLLAKNIITRDVTSLFAIKMIMHPLFPRFIIFKTTKKKKSSDVLWRFYPTRDNWIRKQQTTRVLPPNTMIRGIKRVVHQYFLQSLPYEQKKKTVKIALVWYDLKTWFIFLISLRKAVYQGSALAFRDALYKLLTCRHDATVSSSRITRFYVFVLVWKNQKPSAGIWFAAEESANSFPTYIHTLIDFIS